MAAATLLTACSGGGSSGPTPPPGIGTVTPTPTETPAPETNPPERPAALDDPGPDGAEALAWYFLDLYPYVYATGDLTEWKTLSHPDCIFCRSVVENVENLHRDNEYESRGGFMTITSIEPGLTGEGLAEFTITADQAASSVLDSNGVVTNQSPASSSRIALFAEWLEGHWVVRGIDVDEIPTL